jgi:hypothetical protein
MMGEQNRKYLILKAANLHLPAQKLHCEGRFLAVLVQPFAFALCAAGERRMVNTRGFSVLEEIEICA